MPVLHRGALRALEGTNRGNCDLIDRHHIVCWKTCSKQVKPLMPVAAANFVCTKYAADKVHKCCFLFFEGL